MELAQLVARVATERDPDAFRTLVERLGPRLRGYLVRGLGEAAVADEVLQDVMLTLWHRSADYDPRRASVETWAFTIGRHRMLDHLRRRRRGDQALGALSEQPEPLPGAFERSAAAQEAGRVRAAVSSLPAEQQAVLREAYWGAQSLPEIATRNDLPLGTVKSRIRLALSRLRLLLQEPP
jgi:RNA polymerase sigma-70 factor (ECF subfamily)